MISQRLLKLSKWATWLWFDNIIAAVYSPFEWVLPSSERFIFFLIVFPGKQRGRKIFTRLARETSLFPPVEYAENIARGIAQTQLLVQIYASARSIQKRISEHVDGLLLLRITFDTCISRFMLLSYTPLLLPSSMDPTHSPKQRLIPKRIQKHSVSAKNVFTFRSLPANKFTFHNTTINVVSSPFDTGGHNDLTKNVFV